MTQGLSTRCVHAGELVDAHGSPHTPIYTTTTFKFASTADLLDVVDGRKAGSLYTRYGLNPSIASLESKLATLEGAATTPSLRRSIRIRWRRAPISSSTPAPNISAATPI